MRVKENSELKLYANVDVTKDVQIAFKSRAGQTAYFEKKKKYTIRPFYYIRRTGHIKVEISIAQAMECNYLSFVNPDFENKVFYAKITNVEYVSNKVTEFTFAIDTFQTYMFDVQYGWANINREHLSQADYDKSKVNPWDPSIYEFQTAESLPSSRELEIHYTSDQVKVFPDTNATALPFDLPKDSECIFMYISDFDVSEFPNIRTQFYELFDLILDSSGRIVQISDDYSEYIGNIYFDNHIGRGYGIYQIQLDKIISGPETSGNYRFQKALRWLTAQGLSQNIISVYQISTLAFLLFISQSYRDTSLRQYLDLSISPPSYDGIDSGKLYLSPYSYIRVYNNEGDCKEYKYEKFAAIHLDGHSGNAKLTFFPILDGSPMTSLIPQEYNRNTNELVNTEERIDCLQIPQVGYATDAYLAFLSSQMNMNLASRTNTVGENINQGIKREYDRTKEIMAQGGPQSASDVMSLILGVGGMAGRQTISQIGGAFSSIMGGDVGGATTSALNAPAGATTSLRNEADTWRSGDNYESEVFGPAKSAFVADEYHPGSTNGTLGEYLITPRSPGTFTVVTVRLNPTILRVYDEFFKGYGYSSNRIGVPRICNYITGTGEQPHFAEFQGKEITYVKTSSMTVEHNLARVCEDIETMFNTGIQLLKGEDL